MAVNKVFNATVCIIGIFILIVHSISLLIKKGKRNDEKALLVFFLFTAFHFLTYLIFTFISEVYTSNAFVTGFYTAFYIMNNIEILLFYIYMVRYIPSYNRKKLIFNVVTYSLFALFVISDILNIFTKMYFSSVNGTYTRRKYMIFAQMFQFIILVGSFLFVNLNKQLLLKEKIVFSVYCLLPFASIIVQIFFPGYAIAYAVLLITIEVLFVFLSVEKNIKLAEDEKQLKEADVKLMVSQIQPHFVYNTLSSISTLITIDPEKAQKLLDDFTNYLRMNFSTLTETRLVSFEDELNHIKTYINLEKIRFQDKLNFIYDIGTSNFFLPPLSVQPIVENAVKHGLFNKNEGGTIILKTYETDDSFIIEVIDDGVGFDSKNIDLKSNKHIGLKNVYYRITNMCHGNVKVNSELNKGTKVTVTIYKE